MNSNCVIKLSKIVEGQIFTTHVFHILSTCIPDDTGHSLFVHFSQVNHRCRRPGWATEKNIKERKLSSSFPGKRNIDDRKLIVANIFFLECF